MKKIKDILTKKELNKIERSEKKRFGATRKELEPFTLSLMIENYKPVKKFPWIKVLDTGAYIITCATIAFIITTILIQYFWYA